ncbi:MAG: ComEC/Rec2 family competence protein [Phycisphaeraceae bacterium]|nr:ComEC/Rec2 family competence protein [Phycisphaerales bacterium]MCB9859875.1 ComEC/Rec2 family competence protein [Phycisphaeraceae bacterium]
MGGTSSATHTVIPLPEWIPTGAARRACIALACLVTGILVGRALLSSDAAEHSLLASSGLWTGAIFGVLVAVLAIRRAFVLALAMMLVGVLMMVVRVGPWPDHSVVHQLSAASSDRAVLVDIGGVVSSAARIEHRKDISLMPRPDVLVFDLRIVHSALAPEQKTSGTARIRVDLPENYDAQDAIGGIAIGDRVRVMGRATQYKKPLNPGERDTTLLRRQAGLACTVSVPNMDLVTSAEHLEVPMLLHALTTLKSGRSILQRRASRWMDNTFGSDDDDNAANALLRALVLGKRDNQESQEIFARTGVAHLLAISGFHLAVLAWLMRLCVRLTGDWGRFEPVFVGAMVLVYVALVPANPPIVRAATLVFALMGAEALGRRYDPVAVLAWTACGMLICKPMDAFNMGFHLTFVLVGALLVLTPMIAARFEANVIVGKPGEAHRTTRVQWIWAQSRDLFVTNVMCWLIATPIVMYHAGLLSVIGVVATILVGPVVVVVLMLGAVMLCAAAISHALGTLIGSVVVVPAELAVLIVRWCDSIPGSSVRVPAVSIAWVVAAVVYGFFWCGRVFRYHWRSRIVFAIGCVVLLGWLAVEIRFATHLSSQTALRVDTLAVGDGTCHILRSDRDALLWDCGSLGLDIGVRLVPNALRAVGGWRVPTAILTHPNIDHYNGLVSAANDIGLRRVLVTQRFLDTASTRPHGAAADLLRDLEIMNIEILTIGKGDVIPFGSMQLRVLWPPKDPVEVRRFAFDNDTSVVALIESTDEQFATRRMLMTGDIQRSAMIAIMTEYPELQADMLELPHHGSYSDVSHEFVGMLSPAIVVQSTGVQRLDETRWDRAKQTRQWYATPDTGAITTELLRDGTWRVRTMR